MEKKWYILRIISGKENKIKNSIEKEIKKHYPNNIGELLIPIRKFFKIKKGKKIKIKQLYYPGYIMIELKLENIILQKIKNINGVINFLLNEKKGLPIEINKKEIENIKKKIYELSNNSEKTIINFIVGEQIKIIDGPFNGFNGTIEKINEEKKKLELSVLIFGRKTPLELDFSQIEKII
ncbi:transcription termination/antitermination protein NusG [Candidatus Shikimatogenerans silvanidophilus]|uniref:transcription termination/antitermination protein NusG n=1 Tax=Candidatus Shikimatogenerans silvanidophilus TaxID=2782547 RepID=UPI002A4E1EF1|nr:transcription termination/antitermination protein NusG [Candidatus Shikimatogenerans silvanidophilus]